LRLSASQALLILVASFVRPKFLWHHAFLRPPPLDLPHFSPASIGRPPTFFPQSSRSMLHPALSTRAVFPCWPFASPSQQVSSSLSTIDAWSFFRNSPVHGTWTLLAGVTYLLFPHPRTCPPPPFLPTLLTLTFFSPETFCWQFILLRLS